MVWLASLLLPMSTAQLKLRRDAASRVQIELPAMIHTLFKANRPVVHAYTA
jgi:hypothetical protein